MGDTHFSGPVYSENGFVGDIVIEETAYTADGAIDTTKSFVELDASSASTVMTIAAPVKGQYLVITCTDASNTVTVTLTAGTFDGTNEIATFDAAAESLVLFGISATRYIVVENVGGVVLST